MRRASLLAGVVCLIASIAVVGSALANGGGATNSSSPTVAKTQPLRQKAGGGPFTVKIKVLQKGGETLALVPVTVHGEKLAFIVDTGASTTQVTTKVAEALGLAKVGKAKTVSGVGCSSKTQPVKVDEWSVAGHALPTSIAGSSNLALTKGSEVAGLLGSDVWSKFGSLKVDYANETLTVG